MTKNECVKLLQNSKVSSNLSSTERSAIADEITGQCINEPICINGKIMSADGYHITCVHCTPNKEEK